MKKYLELFKDGFDDTLTEKIKPENWPYVGYSPSEGVVFTVIPEPVADGPWVTFTAEEDNSSIGLNKLSLGQTLEYSTDTTNWNTFGTKTNISLNNGDKVYVRGLLRRNNTSSTYTQFKMSGRIAASGNCNAIWNYQDLNALLQDYCGYSMFRDCTSLVTAPELPTTKLSSYCYSGMFLGCSSLTTAPELPATTLAPCCYQGMFSNCISLATAPKILPATTLASNCYQNMFGGCKSLTTALELPATTLATGCYASMFQNCASLTTAPELPAAELAENCYYQMFRGCTSLNYIKCLATNISFNKCTVSWVGSVSPTGTFVKHTYMFGWPTGPGGIPSGWTIENAVL